jgi:hypothetical protein
MWPAANLRPRPQGAEDMLLVGRNSAQRAFRHPTFRCSGDGGRRSAFPPYEIGGFIPCGSATPVGD